MPGGENALQMTIPPNSQYTTGYGTNKDVWSWIYFPIAQIAEVGSVDFSGLYLTYCVKFDNAAVTNSIILRDGNGVMSKEHSAGSIPNRDSAVFYSEALSGGWYRIYVNFPAFTGETFEQRQYPLGAAFDITSVTEILITVSNGGKDTSKEAKIYFTGVFLSDEIGDGGVSFVKPEFYPRKTAGDSRPHILFLGNSFIYSSDIAAILQGMIDENGGQAVVESWSLGNGVVDRIFDAGYPQWQAGVKGSWGLKLFSGDYDAVFLQAVWYDPDEAAERFIEALNGKARVILLPADNESAYVLSVYGHLSSVYGLTLMDWCGLVRDLKIRHGLNNFDLNQAADDWHANALSGYAAATMIYYSLYGVLPENSAGTRAKLAAGYHIAGSSIAPYDFLMRGTDAEKQDRFDAICAAAQSAVDDAGAFIALGG
jgi:hypothetical protein